MQQVFFYACVWPRPSVGAGGFLVRGGQGGSGCRWPAPHMLASSAWLVIFYVTLMLSVDHRS